MEADPSIVLEWLDPVNDELRELQLTALEQLCNEVLFSDNIDVFFERYPPRLFIPALCKIFLDELAPDSVLEANARALTYYLDVSLDCAPRIARSPNVLTAMTSRLDAVDMTSAKSNELGQQIVKMLQLVCTREPGAVYAAGGLTSVLRYIRLYPHLLHADVLQAGMDIIRRLFTRADPRDTNLTSWIDALSSLLDRRETGVADQALRAFANLVSRFTRTGTDPSPLADPHIIDCLLQRLRVAGGVEADNELTDSSGLNLPSDASGSGRDGISSSTTESNPVAVHAVTNILTSLCCNSVSLTHKLLTNDGQFAMTLAMVIQRSTDELVVLSVLRLIEILLVLLYQTQNTQSNSDESSQLTDQVCKSTISNSVVDDTLKQNQVENKLSDPSEFQSSVSIIEHAENSQNTSQSEHTNETSLESQHSWEGDAVHHHFIEAIKRQDLDLMKRSLKSGKIDVNYMDHLGQTLLNWAASFGSPAMVELLCTHGANVNLGVRSPLDYAASFGRVEICRTLLNWGADINKQDAQGRKPIDRAREHPDFPGSHQVIDLLESESKRASFRSLSSKLDKLDKHQTTGSSSSSSVSFTQHKINENRSNDPAEAQRLFIYRLLPLLVGLFKESTSSSVRHQCTLLVWRMIQYMRPDHLETISLMDNQSVPFAFSLTQMIHTVLIEEREELISRALELSLRLLHKSPHIYILVFYRLGLIPLIQIIVDILNHLLIMENKSAATCTTTSATITTTTITEQQLSVSSSDENVEKDTCVVSVTKTITDVTTTTTVTTVTAAASTSASYTPTTTTTTNTNTNTTTRTTETTDGLSLKNTLTWEIENKAKPVSTTRNQQVCEVVSTDSEGDNCISEMLSAPAAEEPDRQSILPSTSVLPDSASERVYLNAQLYHWHGWYFFCMGQLLSIFNGFAFITIQLQPEDGCLRVLCIHYSAAHRNSPVPIQLHPGESPVPRPGLKSRMLRMHQHLMELIDSNITITPLFKEDIGNESTTENAAKQQTHQQVSPKITQLDILTHSSLCNLEASRNNARRFRKRLGLRHDPVSVNTAVATPMTTFGDNLPRLQRQASSPARVCLTSRFLTKLPNQSFSTDSSSGLLTPTTSVSFGSIICGLIKQKDGTYVSVKPRVSSTHTAKPLFNEALLLSGNFCSGFKRVRIASASRDVPVTELNSTPCKAPTNPNLLLKSTKRHSRSFINMFSHLDLPPAVSYIPLTTTSATASTTTTSIITTASTTTAVTNASLYSPDSVPEIFDFDSLINSDSLNLDMDYLHFYDATSDSNINNNNLITADFNERKSKKTDQLLAATTMELSRLDKLFFPSEIVHETYNSGQLVVLLRPEDDDSPPESAAERLILLRKHMLTLANRLLEKLQVDLSFSDDISVSPLIIGKIGPINALNSMKQIVMQIWDIFKTDKNHTLNVTLNKLFTTFKKLSNLLHEGEQAITAYELTTSGLIQVLLLCLSIAHAGRWHCHEFSTELDSTTALLWCLQERRRVFVQNMLSSSRCKSMSLLVRRLVQAFELTEHLPLRLFSAAHLSRSSSSKSASEHNSSSNRKLTPDSEKTTNRTQTKSHAPATLMNKIGYSASLPINFINFSCNRHSTIYTDHGDSVAINVKQPFQDSIDAKELAALLRFCPILLDFPEFDLCLPNLHQISKRLPLYLDKLSKPPLIPELNNNNTQDKLRNNNSKQLYNWRGKILFVSPLATVYQLERFLNRMSTKQWYECSRVELSLWNQIDLANGCSKFTGLYFPAPPPGNSSADYLGGVIDWLATNGNCHPLEDWVNPAIVGLVSIAASTSNPVKGRAVSILGPQAGALVGGYTVRGSGIGVVVKPKRMNSSTNGSSQSDSRGKKMGSNQKSGHTSSSAAAVVITENETHAWIAIDLGLDLVPTAYTLAYLRRADASEHSLAPRNWKLEASNDAISWIVLREHTNDSSIQSVSGSRATWGINLPDNQHINDDVVKISSSSYTCVKQSTKGWRFFKIQTTGLNANGGKQLALGGLEFYGNVYSVYDSVLPASIIAQRIYSVSLSERKDVSATTSPLVTLNKKMIINNPNDAVIQNKIDYDHDNIGKINEKPLSQSPNLNIILNQFNQIDSGEHQEFEDGTIHNRDVTSGLLPSQQKNVTDGGDDDEEQDNIVDEDDEDGNSNDVNDRVGDNDDVNDDADHDGDDDDDEDDNDDSGAVCKTVPKNVLNNESSDDPFMNILFDEEAGSDDNVMSMSTTDRSDVDIILELSAKRLDDLNILSSGTVDDKFLRCFGNFLANDKSSPELCRLLRRIASQDIAFDLSNKCASRSMDSIHSRDDHQHSKMITYKSKNAKRFDSVLDTGMIDISEPHISYIDQNTTETTGESDEYGLSYLLNSIEPEALEFADTVEAIIRSNTVQDRQNINDNDDNNPVDLTTTNKDISTASSSSLPWKHFKLIQNNKSDSDLILMDRLTNNNKDKKPESFSESTVFLSQSTLHGGLPVIKTISTEPCSSTEDTVGHNQQIHTGYQSSKNINETASFTASISSDSSGFQVLPPSWKPTHQQFRRRVRRTRPHPVISSESKDAISGHSNSLHPSTPQVPLSWNEATDALRLPLGLIPAFIPNPGSTNAPGTTAYVLCRPPSKKPEFTNDNNSYSTLSLFLGIYMNSEYLIQIPLRDKNATLFNYIQELSEKFEALQDSNKYHLSKSIDGDDKTKNNYLIKLGYRFSDVEIDSDQSPSSLTTVSLPTFTGSDNNDACDIDKSTARTFYGLALLNKHDLRFTPSLGRPISYMSTGIKIPMIGSNDAAADDNDDGDINNDNADDVNSLTNKLNNSSFNYNIQTTYPPSDPEDILQLLKLLYQLSGLKEFYFNDINNDSDHALLGDKSMKRIDENLLIDKNEVLNVKMEYFTSTRLTNKLLRQIHDPLALASGALPNWCISLSQRFNVLFSYNVRSQLFSACAFGPARAVVWLQNRPLQKRTYVSHPDAYSRSGSAGNTSGRSSYRILLPSVNASLISALLNNTSATTGVSANNTNGNHPLDDGASTTPSEDIVLLRPSILTHLLNISSSNSRAVSQNMNSVQQDEMNTVNNDFDANSEEIPSFESILSNLSIPLPSTTTSSSLNCDNYLSGNIGGIRSTTTNNDLINCLLVHANNNDQHLTTSSATAVTTPNGAGIGFSPDDRSTLQIGRLHKEFVRIPRLPHELLIQSANKCMKASHTTYHNSDMLSMTFWHWASRLMEEHASRKSELEIQFIGEEGTGLGPTLEFYSLLAAELRRRDGLMWVTDDFSLAEQLNQTHSNLPTVSSLTTIEENVISRTGNHNYSADNETDDIDEENIYVNTPHGLFPAPWPGDQVPESVLYRFFILGIAVAKCLQDNRRIDLPLSPPLLKLLTAYGSVVIPSFEDNHHVELKSNEPNSSHSTSCSIDKVDTVVNNNSVDFSVLSDVESAFQNLLYSCSYSTNQPVSYFCQFTEKEFDHHDGTFNLASFLISPQYKLLYQCCRKRSDNNNTLKTSTHWISGLLNLNDFCIIYPERAQFMRQIAEFHRRKFILLTKNANEKEINDLAVEIFGCDLDDLCISMEFLPPSKLFGFSSYPLKDVYDWESNPTTTTTSTKSLYKNTIDNSQPIVVPVSIHNIEKYLELTLAFCLDKGVRKQLDAFKDGFQRVLPLRWLALFTGAELGQLISGDSVAQWTREDLLAYTVPSLGFTKQSPTYQMLINVLSSFNSNERRAFLQFTTGCSSLPPGGLKNLHPRLRIVRKEITNSGPYPSVNTCVHYLKLPEYQSEKELRTRLLQATKEIGFYLN